MQFHQEKYTLSPLSFFEMLTSEEAALARKNATTKDFKKGQVIIKEGSFSKGIYIIKKGKVKIHSANAEGRESIIYIYKRNDFFGYRPMLAKEPNPVTTTAMENVVLLFIPADVFEDLLDSSKLFARRLLANIASEFTVWINKITLFSQYAVKHRVAMSLLILGRIYDPGKTVNKKMNIRISREDFAAYVGTAKETLVRMLRVFKDEGLITAQGSMIIILKPKTLQEMISSF
jgi:CRP-like cAMP-binding protein